MTAFRPVIRSLARTPLFTAAAVLTLGLGIGATAAAFSVVNAVLLRPLPYGNADRLVVLRQSLIGIGIPDAGLSLGTFYHYRHTSHKLALIAAYVPLSLNLADVNGSTEAERVSAADVSANMMTTLGVSPARGRGFVSADERPNTHVALISDDLWRRRYGADKNILDRDARINGETYRIIGVMPPGFHSPVSTTQLWRPLQLDSLTPHAGSFNLGGIAQLAPGATAEAAQAELNKLLLRLPESFPDLFPTLPTTQLLAQSKAAAVLGIAFAIAVTAMLVRYGPSNFPRLASVHIDAVTAAFTVLVSVVPVHHGERRLFPRDAHHAARRPALHGRL